MIGPVLDRRGARLILCLAVLSTGLATMALSLTQSLLVFYLLFVFARMVWAGPFDLGRPHGCPKSAQNGKWRIPKEKEESPE